MPGAQVPSINGKRCQKATNKGTFQLEFYMLSGRPIMRHPNEMTNHCLYSPSSLKFSLSPGW